MAKLEVRGLGAIRVDFEHMADGLSQRVRTAMDSAAQALARSVQDAGARAFRGKKPDEPLESLVAPGPPLITRDFWTIEVWPHGDYTGIRGKPRPAVKVGFVMEYGHSGMRATRWFSRGTKQAERRVQDILDEIIGG